MGQRKTKHGNQPAKPNQNRSNDNSNRPEKVSGTMADDVQGEVPQRGRKENAESERKKVTRETINLWIQGCTLGAVIVYTTITACQWGAAREANDQARKQFTAMERPWLSLQLTSIGKVRVKEKGIFVEAVTASIENVGHSIARNVAFNPVLIRADQVTGRECSLSDQERKDLQRSFDPEGIVVFPGQHITATWPAPMTIDFVKGKALDLRIVACVVYTSPIDNLLHATRVPYFLFPKDRSTPFSDVGDFDGVLNLDNNGTAAD